MIARAGSRPVPTNFDDIRLALEYVDGGHGQHEAIVCRRTGKIYWHDEYSDQAGLDDEWPDDVENGEKYVAIPDKKELGLGKPLVLDFAREYLPEDFDEVRYIFSKRGAYPKFKTLLMRRRALDRWYAFEAKATEQALREWCAINSIEISG
jgi:hypothetical protein